MTIGLRHSARHRLQIQLISGLWITEGSGRISYSVELIEEAQYVRLTVTGETGKADLEAGRAEAIRLLQANGLQRLLVDARQVQKNTSQIDDYEFVKQHRDTPLQSAKLAVLYRVEETERFSFIEDVAINRSANLKIFTDPDQALEWLLGS